MVSVTAAARFLGCVNSAISVAALGKAPPIPRPATNLKKSRNGMECASAMESVATANSRTFNSSARRRPRRSPAIPPATAPSATPKSPSARTGVKAALLRCQSLAMAGTAKPINWMSMPSKTMASAVQSTIHACCMLKLPASSTESSDTDRLAPGRDCVAADRLSNIVSSQALSIGRPT